MLKWNVIGNYDKDILAEVNIENGVKLPEINNELLFEGRTEYYFLVNFEKRMMEIFGS
jgi:hypothetical protein